LKIWKTRFLPTLLSWTQSFGREEESVSVEPQT
jgi:hypothetical protein